MIDVKKIKLKNGLIVILHEDHTEPIVHIDVTYRTGASDDPKGRSGLAHLVEHMLFEGSENVGPGEHYRILSSLGGEVNARTTKERTSYFQTVPAHHSEKVLWLESDRMSRLLPAVSSDCFQLQREIIKSERAQTVDNRPYGLVNEKLTKLVYGVNHPYGRPVIGYSQDFDRIRFEDVKQFYSDWYQPNNAIITIGGHFSSSDMIKQVRNYFETIPSKRTPKHLLLPVPSFQRNRNVKINNPLVPERKFLLKFVGAPVSTRDEMFLNCIAFLLGQGKNSILYENLIKSKEILTGSVINDANGFCGEFTIEMVPRKKCSAVEVRRMFAACLIEIRQKGIGEQRILEYRGLIESKILEDLQGLETKCRRLSNLELYQGDCQMIRHLLSKFNELSIKGILKALSKYIEKSNSICLEISNDTITKPRPTLKQAERNKTIPKVYAREITQKKAVYAKLPADGPIVSPPNINISNTKFPNGLSILFNETLDLPVVAIIVTIRVDSDMSDSVSQFYLRIISLMLIEKASTNGRDIRASLNELGCQLQVENDSRSIRLKLNVLSRNFRESVAIFKNLLLDPTFEMSIFMSVKSLLIYEIIHTKSYPALIASELFKDLIYGKNNQLDLSHHETELLRIDLESTVDFFSKVICESTIEVAVSGYVSRSMLNEQLSFLDNLPWHINSRKTRTSNPLQKAIKSIPRFVILNLKGWNMVETRIGYETGLKYDSLGEFFVASLMNYPLGESPESRLNSALREEEGWTYRAISQFKGDSTTGDFTFYSSLQVQTINKALQKVTRVFDLFAENGISNEELFALRSSDFHYSKWKLRTLMQKAQFIQNIQEHKLPYDVISNQRDMIKEIKEATILNSARKWIDSSQMSILLLGDVKNIRRNLDISNFEVVNV